MLHLYSLERLEVYQMSVNIYTQDFIFLAPQLSVMSIEEKKLAGTKFAEKKSQCYFAGKKFHDFC